VGYDEEKMIENKSGGGKTTGALLIRNSWGQGWGERGYGWLPYDYVLKGLAEDFWSVKKTPGGYGRVLRLKSMGEFRLSNAGRGVPVLCLLFSLSFGLLLNFLVPPFQSPMNSRFIAVMGLPRPGATGGHETKSSGSGRTTGGPLSARPAGLPQDFSKRF
jgi:hypothetical protein